MKKIINNSLSRIPSWLSSKISVFIYIFLFGYLVIFALIAVLVPWLNPYAPSDGAQLVLGNYTNVLSALGASIAAGSGIAIHDKVKAMHERHRKLHDSIDELHRKIDRLSAEKQ
ncbi:MAG: hypothetical protein FWE10_04940 [Rikenellaceae bacterium]|nr:hypothetical protein [Rikenellaceae bacterium]MCL2692422.1 hypothetical protein [Rikenellaceae bacterium]